jgi:hypothetical protein
MEPDFSNIPLRDIHLPEAVSWWPPALGWWLLLAATSVLIVLMLWYIKRRQRLKLQKAALSELEQLSKTYQQYFDDKRFVRDLSALLRRICVSAYPKRHIAGLIGKEWLAFLDSQLAPKANKSGHKFSGSIGKPLLTVPYNKPRPAKQADVEALYTLSKEWILSLKFAVDTKPQTNKPLYGERRNAAV